MSKFDHQIELIQRDIHSSKIDIQFCELCMDTFDIEIEDYLDIKHRIGLQAKVIIIGEEVIRCLQRM